MSDWTFLSNHGHVLTCLVQDGEARLRDVAERVGITERAVQKIVRDMQQAGVLSVSKHGRRNRYRVNGRKTLRHQLESHRRASDLVHIMQAPVAKESETRTQAPQKKKTKPEPDTSPPPPLPEPPIAEPVALEDVSFVREPDGPALGDESQESVQVTPVEPVKLANEESVTDAEAIEPSAEPEPTKSPDSAPAPSPPGPKEKPNSGPDTGQGSLF